MVERCAYVILNRKNKECGDCNGYPKKECLQYTTLDHLKKIYNQFNKIGRLDDIDQPSDYEPDKCIYKKIVDEILFPTTSHCELCDGYDKNCCDYKTEQ